MDSERKSRLIVKYNAEEQREARREAREDRRARRARRTGAKRGAPLGNTRSKGYRTLVTTEWHIGMRHMSQVLGISARKLCEYLAQMPDDLKPVRLSLGWSMPRSHAVFWLRWYYWKAGWRRRSWVKQKAEALAVQGNWRVVKKQRSNRWRFVDGRTELPIHRSTGVF